MAPRRSARQSDPKPTSNEKQVKAITRKASFLSLPFELKVSIFRHISKPCTRDLKRYARAQSRLANFCLICKGLLDAARAVLLSNPLFAYRGAVRSSFIKAYDMDKQEANDAARKINSFAMIDIPCGSQNKRPRITLLEAVCELSALTSIHLVVGKIGSSVGIGLSEVIVELSRNEAKCVKSLMDVRLEGFSASAADAVHQLSWFCSFPRLRTLHLQLSQSSVRQPALASEASNPFLVSKLLYLVFGFDVKLAATQAEAILDQLPLSLVTFGFLAYFSKSTSLAAVFALPKLRYLALKRYPADEPLLP